MPRTKFPAIQIEGAFEQEVLGTFNIIRGFATLQKLAKISAPFFMREIPGSGTVEGHQRPLDKSHAEEVKRYFEDGDCRFIPEVILSIRADWEKEIIDNKQVGVSYSANGLTVSRKHKGKTLNPHIIHIDSRYIEALKTAGRIRRIDGNHRLDMANQLLPDPHHPNKYKVPFCVILLGAPDNNIADDYNEALIFHSINSTAKPLDSEHALQLIIRQPHNETRLDKEFSLSPSLHFTRLLHEHFNKLPEPAKSRLGSRPLASLAIAAKEMLHTYPEKKASLEVLENFAAELNGALFDICTRMTPAHADLCQAEYFVELATHVWMRSTGTNHEEKMPETQRCLEQMAGWLGHDGLRNLSSGKTLGKQLLAIYDEVRRRIPKKVFLARWYPTTDQGDDLRAATRRLEQIETTLKKIKTDHGIHLDLIDMGTQAALVTPIHAEMYNAIAEAEIILIDLTGIRPNVCIEAGFALNHHHRNRLIFIFQPTEKCKEVPFDLNTYRHLPIREAADIPGELSKALLEIMRGAAIGAL